MYAVDFHHRKERHLYSMGLQNLFTRPAILIVDAASQVRWVSGQLGPDLCVLKRLDHSHRDPHCLLACLDTATAYSSQQHMHVWHSRPCCVAVSC